MLGASNPEVLGDTSEGRRDGTMTEDHDAHQQQHHFSSLSAATAAQIRPNSLFSAIDPDHFGRASIETVVDYLESANGFSGVYRILTDTTGGFVLQVNSNSNPKHFGSLAVKLEEHRGKACLKNPRG